MVQIISDTGTTPTTNANGIGNETMTKPWHFDSDFYRNPVLYDIT